MDQDPIVKIVQEHSRAMLLAATASQGLPLEERCRAMALLILLAAEKLHRADFY
jgi:hypothetical protein